MARTGFKLGVLLAANAMVAAATAQVVPGREGARRSQSLAELVGRAQANKAKASSATAGTTCFLTSPLYKDYESTPQPSSPLLIGAFGDTLDFNDAWGLPEDIPSFIDLTWGPDHKLYGVSNATAVANANTLYRIDLQQNGAATAERLGTVSQSLGDGDLATDPDNGLIYLADGQRIYTFAFLKWNTPNPYAKPLGNAPLPPGWRIIGLAFDAGTPSRLFAIAQSPPGTNAPKPMLLELGKTAPVGNVQIINSVQLPQRFGTHGGLALIDGQMMFIEGSRPPAAIFPPRIYTINTANGAVVPLGPPSYQPTYGYGTLASCVSEIKTCRPPPPDMVAWYPFNNNLNDQVMGNNAVHGGPGLAAFLSGKVTQALNTYPTGHFAYIPPGPLLNQGKGDFSIDAWIRLAGVDAPDMRTIADKRAGTLGGGTVGWVFFIDNNRLALQLGDGKYTNYFDTRPMSAGWHHVAVTIDRDNPKGIVFYIDGQPGTPQDATPRQGSLDNAAPTLIGKHVNGVPFAKWLGLDELEFFDRALTPAEVLDLWKADKFGKCK